MAYVKSRMIIGLMLVAAACGNTTATTTTGDSVPSPTASGTLSIANQGGTLEGHTPIGFAGTGTGLFVGDNLNPSFPEGDGVQTFLTFALPEGINVVSAIVRSDMLSTAGAPFEDLGSLLIEPITYSEFGPQLFDLSTDAEATACRVTGSTTLECDVTKSVSEAVAQSRDSVKFRLRFEKIADNDGAPDLAQFYRSDSNTNEAGLFNLVISSR